MDNGSTDGVEDEEIYKDRIELVLVFFSDSYYKFDLISVDASSILLVYFILFTGYLTY